MAEAQLATRLSLIPSTRAQRAVALAAAIVAIVAAPASTHAADPSVVVDVGMRVPSSAPVEHVFGGRPMSVPLVLHSTPDTRVDLRARFVQVAAGLVAPTGAEMAIASNLDFSAGVRRELSFDVVVPDVERTSSFELVVFLRVRPSETWRPAARLSLRAYPADILTPLRRWTERSPLRVRDASGTLERFLTAERVGFQPLSATLLDQANEQTVTLLVGGSDDLAVAKARASAGEAVVVLRESSTEFPRGLFGARGAGPVLVLHFPVLGRLSVDPVAQHVFLEIIRSARALSPRAEEGAGHDDRERR